MMTTDQRELVKCPSCGRRVEVSRGLDGASVGRCGCGQRVVLIESVGEDGGTVRQVVVQRRPSVVPRAHRR